MRDTLCYSHLSLSLIVKVTEGERQSRKFLVNFCEDKSGSLHFESVVSFDITLEHSSPKVSRPDLPISGSHGNINSIHLSLLKGTLWYFFLSLFNILWCGIFECYFLNTINNEALHLVHAH